MLELVLFDMDGVIFEGKNFWLELHKLMGTEKQAWQLWKGLGAHAYDKLSHLTAMNLWRQKSSDEFWRLIYARRAVTGVDQVFTYLNENRIKSAIISSGAYQLAERAQRLFSITEIRANKLGIGQDGEFTGQVEIQVDDNHKDIPAKEIMSKFGASYDTTAVIGDSESDIAIAKLASLSIAYDCSDRGLLEICSFRVAAGEILKVIEVLRERIDRGDWIV
jgi:HAD superfamily phosphoserine phosphatase-like hydrolase